MTQSSLSIRASIGNTARHTPRVPVDTGYQSMMNHGNGAYAPPCYFRSLHPAGLLQKDRNFPPGRINFVAAGLELCGDWHHTLMIAGEMMRQTFYSPWSSHV